MALKPFVGLFAVAAATTLAITPAVMQTATAAPPTPPVVSKGSARFIVTKVDNGRVTTQGLDRATTTAASKVSATVTKQRQMGTGQQAVVLDRELSTTDTTKYIAALKSDPTITNVEIDAKMYPLWTPNDPEFSSQWHYNNLRVPQAWDAARGNGVKVAVIDTGVINHPDLRANIIGGYDFIDDASTARDGDGRDANPNDEGDWVETNDPDCGGTRFRSSSWHGSHVAGTIAAVTNNGSGVAGVAPGAKVVPLRALGRCGGYTSDIADAIVWASGESVPGIPANPNKADVINMSIGGKGACATAYQTAINTAVRNGSTVVVAAGNETEDTALKQPASCQNVITVGASGRSDKTSSYSNYGAEVDLTAPGGDGVDDVISTIDRGARKPEGATIGGMQGTSMATPHVSGVAALVKSIKPGLTHAQVEQILKSSTRSFTCTHSGGCGTGLLDAALAVRNAGGTTPTVKPTEPTTPTTAPGVPGGGKIVNGGFEQGATGWNGDTSKVIGTSPFKANTGTYRALFGNLGKRNTTKIEQKVSVPRAGSLSFYLGIETTETSKYTAYDTLTVKVDGRSVATFSNKDATDKYLLRKVDLSAYAGKSVTITFEGTEDVSGRTAFVLDDVALS